MGAEAICRGAAIAVGIEQSPRACAIVRQNWQQVADSTQQVQVLQGDVRQRLNSLAGQQFDRIYFDPPYASELYAPVLQAIDHLNLLAAGGELAVEHRPDSLVLPELASLEICRQKVYGNTALTFFCRSLKCSSR